MQDPFGNEFCVISLLSGEESAAVLAAAHDDAGDDARLRAAAGRLSSERREPS